VPSPPPVPLGHHTFKVVGDLTEDRVWLVVDGKRVYGMAYEDARKLILQALAEVNAMGINRIVLKAAKDVIRKEKAEDGGTATN